MSVTFHGCHGSITAADDGTITSREGTARPESEDFYERQCPCGDWGCRGYGDIVHVDVAEWRAWRRDVLMLPGGDTDDILAVATWEADGSHSPAEADWRAEAIASRAADLVGTRHLPGVFTMTDQPETCPQCGARAEIRTEQVQGTLVTQVCLCRKCDVTWTLQGRNR